MADKIHKKFEVRENRADLARQFSELNGSNVSALLREWLESYVLNGSDIEPPLPWVQLQTVVPRSLLQAAKDRADSEGLRLIDIINHEIDQIDQL